MSLHTDHDEKRFLDLVSERFRAGKARKTKLSTDAFDYYASGSDDERALARNRDAFERVSIHHRVLVDVSERVMKTRVLGVDVSMPVLVAPTAFHKMACEDGELATARAARASGTAMILSSLSNTDIEEVCAAHPGGVVFQLYVYRDREATVGLVRRAEAAGAKAHRPHGGRAAARPSRARRAKSHSRSRRTSK